MNARIFLFPARAVMLSCMALAPAARAQDATAADTVAASVREPAAMPELFSVGYIAQVLGSLLVVFVCLFAVIYLLKRFNRMSASGNAPLRVIGSASVGQRERVVLIEAGDEQLLLGVAPGSVRTLHVLPEPIQSTQDTASGADFAGVLRAANPLGSRS